MVERLLRGVAVLVAPVQHADLGGDGEPRHEARVPLHHDARQLPLEVADEDAAGGRPQRVVGTHGKGGPVAAVNGGEVDVFADPVDGEDRRLRNGAAVEDSFGSTRI